MIIFITSKNNKGDGMKMKIITVFALALTTGCSSMVVKNPEIQKVKRVAVVGFTLDYSLPLAGRFKSVLMGNESKIGMSKAGAHATTKPIAHKAYSTFVQDLKASGWRVLSKDKTLSSPTLNAFYNKKIKKGYLPLQSFKERYKVEGMPQYHYIQALKKTPKLQKIAKELGVDALVFVYFNTSINSFLSLGPIKIGPVHYRSQMMVDVYDPFIKKNVLKGGFTGKKTYLDKSQVYRKGSKTQYGTFQGLQNASKGIVAKMKDKMQ